MDFGLDRAGFETLASVERDKEARHQLVRQRPHANLFPEEDVCNVTAKALCDFTALRPGELTLLAGGPPCQPFSRAGAWAGKPRAMKDPRARPLDAYFRLVRGLLPQILLLENVTALATAHADGLQKRLRTINARTGTNYKFDIVVIQAAEYGVPQLRKRAFLIAHRDGRQFAVPPATHYESTFTTAWDAIGSVTVDKKHENLMLRGKWAGLLPTIPEGHNYLFHTPRGEGLPIFGWRRRYWSFLLKLAKDKPSWTITASPGPASGPFHWDNRRLSAMELAALQTIPLIKEVDAR